MLLVTRGEEHLITFPNGPACPGQPDDIRNLEDLLGKIKLLRDNTSVFL